LALNENPVTAPERLRQLAIDDTGTHYHLAKNPTTPPDVLVKLYKMNKEHLKNALVKNPKSPAKVLSGIYFNDALSSRNIENLAKNPNTPADFFLHMVNELRDLQVTQAVAGNPSTSTELISRIHEGEYVITNGVLRRSAVERSLFCNTSTPATIKQRLPFLLNTKCQRD
jgi:hypothetical protein